MENLFTVECETINDIMIILEEGITTISQLKLQLNWENLNLGGYTCRIVGKDLKLLWNVIHAIISCFGWQ